MEEDSNIPCSLEGFLWTVLQSYESFSIGWRLFWSGSPSYLHVASLASHEEWGTAVLGLVANDASALSVASLEPASKRVRQLGARSGAFHLLRTIRTPWVKGPPMQWGQGRERSLPERGRWRGSPCRWPPRTPPCCPTTSCLARSAFWAAWCELSPPGWSFVFDDNATWGSAEIIGRTSWWWPWLSRVRMTRRAARQRIKENVNKVCVKACRSVCFMTAAWPLSWIQQLAACLESERPAAEATEQKMPPISLSLTHVPYPRSGEIEIWPLTTTGVPWKRPRDEMRGHRGLRPSAEGVSFQVCTGLLELLFTCVLKRKNVAPI